MTARSALVALAGFAAISAARSLAAAPASDEPRVVAVDVGTPPPVEPAPVAPARPRAEEPTAAEVAGAPVPGAESGRVDPVHGDSRARRVARGLLAFPSGVYQLVMAPIRGGVWAWDRYEIRRRTRDIFFNDDGTIGLYPTARLESGFGVNVGARFMHRDVLGAGERLTAYAGTGGRYRQIGHVELRSGDRLGDLVELEIDVEYERRPKDVHYGIGNDGGVEGRFRQRIARAASVLEIALVDSVAARGSLEVKDVELARSLEGPPIDDVLTPDELVGWGGIRLGYAELALAWDTRRAASPWLPAAIHSTGWLVAGFAGPAAALRDGATFWRLGVDGQRFVGLGEGPRVVIGRVHVEGVVGDGGDVPFTELPRLGGKSNLRGYPDGRYRDRVAALASVEYEWALSRAVTASLFVDAGQVFRSRPDLDPGAVHVGYGAAVQGYTRRSFLVRLMVASSIDGGLQLDIAFDPVFDLDPRVNRR